MGGDESHFNVSVGSDGQSHKTVSANHKLFENKGEPKRYRAEVLRLTIQSNALPLGQTGSQVSLTISLISVMIQKHKASSVDVTTWFILLGTGAESCVWKLDSHIP